MSTWAELIGTRVTGIRTHRGMSLSGLAREAGVSKATLSGLEAGTGNPTLDTVERLALALAIPVADLLISDERGTRVVRSNRESQPADRHSVQLLARVSGIQNWEVWNLSLPPGTHFSGVPHSPGTVELIRVAAGSLHAGPNNDSHELHPGDLIEFAGDCLHEYTAGPNGAEAIVSLGSTGDRGHAGAPASPSGHAGDPS